MNRRSLTCPLCGLRFDPQEHPACQACPLGKSCQIVCCPACGYEVLDLNSSRLARLALRILSQNPDKERSVKDLES